MHLPDGFLSTPVWSATAAVSAGYLAFAVRYLKRVLQERLIPIMGVLGAFIFAAQMLNFPVAGGTSGHLLGGVLAAIVVGPIAGSFVLSIVLVVQCLIFQDGGLSTLGANILNIAIIGTLGGYAVLRLISGRTGGKVRLYFSCGLAAWVSVVLASVACAVELSISGTASIRIVLPAMAGIHAIIGVGEAVITVFALAGLRRIRPDLVKI